MKDNKNQHFKTFSTIIVLSFIGTLALSVLAPQPTHNQESLRLEAYKKARYVGKTIASRLTEAKSENGRFPASSEGIESQGYMGTNEEGEPYHYSALKTDAGVARVVVRSGGPKGPIEYVEEGGVEVQPPERESASLSGSH